MPPILCPSAWLPVSLETNIHPYKHTPPEEFGNASSLQRANDVAKGLLVGHESELPQLSASSWKPNALAWQGVKGMVGS